LPMSKAPKRAKPVKSRQGKKDKPQPNHDPSIAKFAFILHPLDMGTITRKYKFAEKVPDKLVAWTLKHKKPWALSEITGVMSRTGQQAVGWFIAVPLLPSQILDLKEKYVVKKIIKGCEVAEELGARIVGLGAFTALVGGGGKDIADASHIAVTTGNTYTVATAIEGARKAAAVMEIDLATATVAVIGATGSIGKIAAHIMSQEAGTTILVGRDLGRLETARSEILGSQRSEVASFGHCEEPEGRCGNLIISTDIPESIKNADVIISATSAVEEIVDPDDIKPGAVVCDVARPRDVAEAVAESRDDVLVIDGGVVQVPGSVDFHFDFGLPAGQSLACMAETMILALEGRYEDYTIGKNITVGQVTEMAEMAERHGFKLAGFRSFERALTADKIAATKAAALRSREKEMVS
jgi:fatty aldehyde-generating acyl-ACP reductase